MRRLLAALVAAGVLWSGQAAAQARCGDTYVVQPGDTLSLIALLALGDPGLWRTVYEFGGNRGVIGENPNAMVAGRRLEMPPCPGEGPPPVVPRPADAVVAVPRDAATAARPSTSGQSAARSASVERPSPRPAPRSGEPRAFAAPRRNPFVPAIRIVTAGDFTPFTGQDLHEQGMATQIVRAAFAASDIVNDVEIEFAEDWTAHLRELIRGNSFSMGFPWTRPDCDTPALLPRDELIRCEYEYSDPIYIAAAKVYRARSDAERPRGFGDLAGARICQPEGWGEYHLAKHGLVDGETAQLRAAATNGGCFEMLLSGEVDYVYMSQFPAERAISDLGIKDRVDALRGFADPVALHVLAHGDNAEAAYIWLEQFNLGLERIRRTGYWDRIVNEHIDRFRRSIGR